MAQPNASELIAIHGKDYRKVIEDHLEFLEAKEKSWGFKFPIDRVTHVRLLVKRLKWAAVEAAEAKKA